MFPCLDLLINLDTAKSYQTSKESLMNRVIELNLGDLQTDKKEEEVGLRLLFVVIFLSLF